MDRSQCPGRKGVHDPRRIGTPNAYKNFGCRCPDAREAARLRDKRHREGRLPPTKVPAVGTTRRLQALACLGYSATTICNGCCSSAQIKTLRDGICQHVTIAIAAHVADFYHEHSDHPLERCPAVSNAKGNAERKKWAPPIAWDWDTIDDPKAKPQHMAKATATSSVNEELVDLDLLLAGRARNFLDHDTRDARRTWRRLTIRAVHILTERGFLLTEIGQQLKLTERQVLRFKKVNAEGVVGVASFNGDAQRAGTTPSAQSTPEEASVA